MNFLDESQKKKLQVFETEILKHNENLNLLSRTDPKNLFDTLRDRILKSYPVLIPYFRDGEKMLDIGSGGGFPGLVLAIIFPSMKFVLCDRKRKKTEFLKSTIQSMGLKNADVYCGDVEDIPEKFQNISSQACAKLPQFLKLCDKVLTPHAQIFLWQSSNWKESFPKDSKFTAHVLKHLSDKTCLLKISK